MRILFVTQYIDHILFFFLEELTKKAEVSVVFDLESEWTGKLSQRFVHAEKIKPRSRFDRRFQAGLESLWRKTPADLIQSFHGNAQLANVIQWNRRRAPVVGYRAHLKHLTFRENPALYWSVRNPHLSAVVALSGAVKNYLESFRFLKPRCVSVITHGINRGWMEAQCDGRFGLRERLGLAPDTFIVASMASLRAYKHFEVVLAAARRLASRPIHFVHLGNAKGWDLRARGLGNVHFLGHQERPFAIVSEADVFASTSHNEALGRSNLEAMALGKPLIGSNTGGLLDLIDDGVTGKLFTSLDEEDFTRQVLFYYEDRSLVAAHSENAIRRVDTHFSTTAMAEHYLRLYASVVQAGATASSA